MIEDFVPYSNERALISAGPGFRNLSFIIDAAYSLGPSIAFSDIKIVRRGKYLRLGHYDGELVSSEGWDGPHQPFRKDGHLYYSDGAPNAKLYRDGELLIDHWPGVAEVCNAWVDDFIWFEARDEDTPAPYGWHLHRADLDGTNIVRLFQGANPCVFGETIYYGLWNGQSFDIATADRRDCLSSDTHLPVGRIEADWGLGETP